MVLKYYGVHLGPVKVPLEEWFPRYDDGGYNFYFQQEDYLKDMQAAKRKWSYNIIRPNAIIGYSPQGVWPTPVLLRFSDKLLLC